MVSHAFHFCNNWGEGEAGCTLFAIIKQKIKHWKINRNQRHFYFLRDKQSIVLKKALGTWELKLNPKNHFDILGKEKLHMHSHSHTSLTSVPVFTFLDVGCSSRSSPLFFLRLLQSPPIWFLGCPFSGFSSKQPFLNLRSS